MTAADIWQLVIGILTLIATAFVPVVVFWQQRKHEREIEQLREEQRQKDISEKANAFLVDHESEREFLPLCVIASNLHRHEKHIRDIYTAFCRCSDEVQNEILRLAGYDISVISSKEWVNDCFNQLREDIKKYELGEDHLYDGAKYFHGGFEQYREKYWKDISHEAIFENIAPSSPFKMMGKVGFLQYVDDFFYYKYDCENPPPKKLKLPIDYAWDRLYLFESEDTKNIEVCKWMMEIVKDITVIIHNRNYGNEFICDNIPCISNGVYRDVRFEDKYYEALLWIYCTYQLKK